MLNMDPLAEIYLDIVESVRINFHRKAVTNN